MTWIDLLWPMVTGACLTLGLINLRIAFAEKLRAVRLWFSLSAFWAALASMIELALMRTDTPARYETLLAWGDLATWGTMTSLTAFIWVFFGTGTKWLAVAGSAAYAFGLLFYLGSDGGLFYTGITNLRIVPTYGGASFRVAEGVPNPWGLLAYVGAFLMMAFVADSSVRLWRRGGRRRAIVVGGSLVFFIVTATVQSALIERGVVRAPYLISWFYLAILIAMGHELALDVFAATKLGRELHVSQQRMGLAAESARLAIWDWDAQRDEVWITPEGRAMLGFGPKEHIGLKELSQRVHPDDRAAREAAIQRALDTRSTYEMEYRLMMPDGAVRWISARGRYAQDDNGSTTGIVGVSMDITRQKQTDLEVERHRQDLGHLARVALVGEMATSLAHELNQPLTAIVTNAGAAQRFLARDELKREELQEVLTDIAADGRRAGEVIRGIKGMVRKVDSARGPVDLNTVIADVLRLVRADALAHDCTLATDLEPDLPAVTGDAVQLQQVLLNLVINAFDAMKQNPGEKCRVELSTRRDGANFIEVAVRDHGPGLPPDAPAKVFERFFSTKKEGMGMGLAIARSIIEAHGGTLDAANVAASVGRGARFWFRLPVRIAAATPPQSS